jgi:CBS domain-containing protein
MVEKNVSALLVLENDKLAGIFTERDYARKVALKGKSSKDTLIADIMTRDLITVTSASSIDECMEQMTGKYIRHLPVVDDGKLSGIISIGDVVRRIIEDQKSIIGHMEQYIAGS